MLLTFIVAVPYLVWRAYNHSELPGGCGVRAPPEVYVDNDNASSQEEHHYIDAKTLFMADCAACHNPIKDATGPSMREALYGRDTGFLYSFLTNRKSLRKDQRIIEAQKKYGGECRKFPLYTRAQTKQLEIYFGLNY